MISIKSNHELNLMKKAGEVLANTFRLVEKTVKPGATTKEIDRIVEEYIRSMGAEPSFKGYQGLPGAVDYPASICASVNNEVVHGIPGLKVLKDGDVVEVDAEKGIVRKIGK
jgi:methionyl aminopeptidase